MKTLTLAIAHPKAFSSVTTTGIVAYLLIVFGVAWGIWIPLWMLSVSPTSDLFAMGVLAPAAAAIVVRQWITHEGFGDAGLYPRLRTRWFYYIFAWLWPLLAFVALKLASPFGLAIQKDVSGDILPSLITSLAMTPVLWCEEFGWRSYLQIRLFPDRPLFAALITGAIWGVWHYPLLLAGFLPNQNGLAGLLAFPVYTILFSILLGWLRLRTGSIWAPSLAHAANNMVLEAIGAAVFAVPVGHGDLFFDPRGLLVIIPLTLLCAWIVLGRQLSGISQGAWNAP